MDVIYALLSPVLTILVLWFWKPWAGAYAGEKGKNLARKEDLDNLLAEVRAVTAIQREIEARISGEMWERQWRLNQKRDVYARLMDLGQQVIDAHIHLLGYGKTAKSNPESARECAVSSAKIVSLDAEWGRAAASAFLFLDQTTLEILPRFCIVIPSDDEEAGRRKAITTLHSAQHDLLQAARVDLGVGRLT